MSDLATSSVPRAPPGDAEIARRLYPDQEQFKADEARRFSLLDAHWDVVLETRPFER